MAKIIGNTTTTPTPRSDWNQTDSTKADYIKNKPEILTEDNVRQIIIEYGGGGGGSADLSGYVKLTDFDEQTIQSLTENSIDLTDEQQSSACAWLGAVPKTIIHQHSDVVFGRYSIYGEYAPLEYAVSHIPGWGNILRCWDINTIGAVEEEGVNGGIYAPTPKQPFQAANRHYVDNLPDYLTLTDDQKAKWAAWLNIPTTESIQQYIDEVILGGEW